MRCRWGDGWRTQERGGNRQGADWLWKHREQGRANESRCRAGVERKTGWGGAQEHSKLKTKTQETQTLNTTYTKPSKNNHDHKPKYPTKAVL